MARQTKITYEQALQVRELAQAKTSTLVGIGEAFGISASHVCNIKADRRWQRDSTQDYQTQQSMEARKR